MSDILRDPEDPNLLFKALTITPEEDRPYLRLELHHSSRLNLFGDGIKCPGNLVAIRAVLDGWIAERPPAMVWTHKFGEDMPPAIDEAGLARAVDNLAGAFNKPKEEVERDLRAALGLVPETEPPKASAVAHGLIEQAKDATHMERVALLAEARCWFELAAKVKKEGTITGLCTKTGDLVGVAMRLQQRLKLAQGENFTPCEHERMNKDNERDIGIVVGLLGEFREMTDGEGK